MEGQAVLGRSSNHHHRKRRSFAERDSLGKVLTRLLNNLYSSFLRRHLVGPVGVHFASLEARCREPGTLTATEQP
jgi:hypothetical protein